MAPPSTKKTIYFGYGSNLWLHQMDQRCPTSKYLGVARLNNYKWIINDRGYANVVEIDSSSSLSSHNSQTVLDGEGEGKGKYNNVVFGLVYSLKPEDEKRLDKNEGVPIAYTKELLACDFWSGVDSDGEKKKVDTSQQPEETEDMLVYIDRKRVEEDKPKKEYIYRMNQGIADAIKMGVPEKYVKDVMRRFIPEEEQQRKSMEEFARRQAVQFRDESGVFQ